MAERAPLVIAGTPVAPGQRANVRIPVARRMTSGEVEIPACVVRGKRDGPVLFVCAALHGDEINGTAIVRELLRMPQLAGLAGTLIAVPVVNVYGFVSHNRYLPDRRDLNRSFPGSATGSLASRLAHAFVSEVVEKSTHGVDLHTGALHRANLPQVRAMLDSKEVVAMARAFGTPVVLDSPLRDGSLREAAHERGIPMVVYEGGEALRFDELAIRAGLRGVVAVMRELGMLRASRRASAPRKPYVARGSQWVRAPETGVLVTRVRLGARVEKGAVLGAISDPLGEDETLVRSPIDGVLIGRTNLPLANEGDALFHVASFRRTRTVAEEVETFREEVVADPELL
ncbi:MAG: succinylglutamate desuccinylase/aspartoacylase family protein [Myxococcota bacterium]